MRISLAVLILGLVAVHGDDSDEDSSEFGVVPGPKGTNCKCGWANKILKKLGKDVIFNFPKNWRFIRILSVDTSEYISQSEYSTYKCSDVSTERIKQLKITNQRIVGGKEAKVNEYPMMAGLYYVPRKVLFCGGTVITRWHVVTAAHCVQPVLHVPEDVQVVLGEHDQSKIDESPHTELVKVKEIVNHPDYYLVGHRNDISVLVMEKKIQFNTFVGPACMPTGSEDILGSKVKVLGWGKLSVDGPASNVLMQANLNVVLLENCIKSYDRINTTAVKQVCTHHPTRDACQGDSGGPLLWLDKETNRYTLVASISYGRGCAEGHPAVNTNIIYYKPWIEQVIRETQPEARMCTKKD